MVGRIGRAVGLRGEVEVLVTSDAPDRFAPGDRLLMGEDLKPVTVRSRRTQNDRTIVSLEGIDDRTGAESVKGLPLLIEADRARPLEQDEYWDHDLIGCNVSTEEGEEVGEVVDVLHQPANEVLVVSKDGREVLIPLVRDVIREVVPRERVVIKPLPGLLG